MSQLLHSTVFFPPLFCYHMQGVHSLWLKQAQQSQGCQTAIRVSLDLAGTSGDLCYLHIKSILQGQKLAIRKQGYVRMHKSYPQINCFLELHQL